MAAHDYDTLFLNLAARGFEISLATVSEFSRAFDPRNPWWVTLRATDSHGRVHLHQGRGPTAYYAILAARSALDAVVFEAEKHPPKRNSTSGKILGLGPDTKASAAALLKELEL